MTDESASPPPLLPGGPAGTGRIGSLRLVSGGTIDTAPTALGGWNIAEHLLHVSPTTPPVRPAALLARNSSAHTPKGICEWVLAATCLDGPTGRGQPRTLNPSVIAAVRSPWSNTAIVPADGSARRTATAQASWTAS